MECFICKGGCGIRVLRYLYEELAWAIDKRFQFTISYYTIPLETYKEATVINNFQLSEQF